MVPDSVLSNKEFFMRLRLNTNIGGTYKSVTLIAIGTAVVTPRPPFVTDDTTCLPFCAITFTGL